MPLLSQRAAVFYTNPLFGCGIARLLSKELMLDVVPMKASLSEVPQLATALQPTLIIVEDSPHEIPVSEFVDALPPVVVIIVRIDSDLLETYRQRREVWPPPKSLSEALVHLGPGSLTAS